MASSDCGVQSIYKALATAQMVTSTEVHNVRYDWSDMSPIQTLKRQDEALHLHSGKISYAIPHFEE